MDKLVNKIVALGVPGLVLLIAMHLTGFAGAAALTAALASLGGPLGMLGGLAVLGILSLIANGLSKYGFEAIYDKVIYRLKTEQNLTEEEIIEKIWSYPISRSMKYRLIGKIREQSMSVA